MKRWRRTLAPAVFLWSLAHPSASGQDLDSLVSHALQYARGHLGATVAVLSGDTAYPRSTYADGSWYTVEPGNWVCGYFPGCLWHMFALSGDSSFIAPAVKWTAGLEAQQFNSEVHDIGLVMICSYGNAYAHSPREEYRQILQQSALSLSALYDPVIGCIRSWHDIQWTYPVIVDGIMPIEILFWAARNGGPSYLRDMAVSHSVKTMENHFRPDGSTYHVVSYDLQTGEVNWRGTNAGYSDSSCWSRGQAWAIYGFAMAFRETGDLRFLQTSERAAQYFLSHLPADHIPYWDFQAPDIPYAERDASAAAIACSGLFELATHVEDQSARAYYRQGAEDILASLCAPPYLSEGSPSMGLINHCVGSYPYWDEIDVSLIYGDYYFLEALSRYIALRTPPTLQFTVATVPPGLEVGIDGSIYTSPQTFTWEAGSTHTLSAPSLQTSPGTRHSFLFWSDGGARTHSIVVDSSYTSDTATYRTDYLLSLTTSPAQGGTVVASPSSTDGYYGSGAMVELLATPDVDFEFNGWSGDVTGTANPDTIVLTAPRSITATFTPATGMKNTYGRLPSTPVLIGSFPNPFNISTTIRYAVPYRMQVTLQVYDGLGQVSAVLDDAVREAGFYQVRLDGVDLASGTYYCRMSAHRPVADSPGAGANGVLSSGDDYVRTIALLLLR